MRYGSAVRVLLFAVTLPFAFPGSAQDQTSAVQPPPASEVQTYTVSGTVVNSSTGDPIARALVQSMADPARSALTDAAGHFHFEGVSGAGVVARKPGYFNQMELHSAEGPASADAGVQGQTQNVVVSLTPEAVVFGRVKNEDDEPVEALPVKLLHAQISNGRKLWQQAGFSITDEDGDFRFASLVPGDYYIEAGPSWGNRFRARRFLRPAKEGYVGTFYPAAPEITAAAPVALAAGEQFEADFSLKSQPMFHVSGSVSTEVTNGVRLELLSQSGEVQNLPAAFHQESGTFEVTVPAGSYQLRAVAQAQGGTMLQGELSLTVRSDLNGVRVALTPQTPIPVVIDAQRTKPLPVGSPQRLIPEATASVHFSAAGRPFGAEYWQGLERNGDENRFSMHDVPPGEYAVEIVPKDGWYVVSAQCGDTDLLHENLTVSPGSPTPAIDIQVRDDGATLTGAVSSEAGPTRGAVIAVPDGNPRAAKMAMAGSDGGFRLSNLAPGGYSVVAIDHGDRIEYTNPEVITAYLSGATHVDLTPNQESKVALNLVPAGK
jgi:hypothetical protein